jgi:hypothetical protein
MTRLALALFGVAAFGLLCLPYVAKTAAIMIHVASILP